MLPLDKLEKALMDSRLEVKKKAVKYILANYGLKGASLLKKAYDREEEGSPAKGIFFMALKHLAEQKKGKRSAGPQGDEKKASGAASGKLEKEKEGPKIGGGDEKKAPGAASGKLEKEKEEPKIGGGDEKKAPEITEIPETITDDWLVKELFSEDKMIRYRAIKAASTSKNPDLARALENHLDREPEDALKAAIIQVIVILQEDKSLPMLLKILVSGGDKEREAAAELVAGFSETKVIRACNRLASSGDPISRIAAISAAGLLNHGEGVSLVMRGLADIKDEVREQSKKSLMILAEGGCEDAKSALVELGLLVHDEGAEAISSESFEEWDEKLGEIREATRQKTGKGLLSMGKASDDNLDKLLQYDEERQGLLTAIGKDLFSLFVGRLLNIDHPMLLPIIKKTKEIHDAIKEVKENLDKTAPKAGLLGKLAGKSSATQQLEGRLRHLGDELDNLFVEIGKIQINRRDSGEKFSDQFERQYLKVKDLEKKLEGLLPLVQL